MLIRNQASTLLQIFCDPLLYSKVIFKCMKEADDTPRGTLGVNWLSLLSSYAQEHKEHKGFNHFQVFVSFCIGQRSHRQQKG